MHIITRRALKDFAENHPEAETPLAAWYKVISKGSYLNLMEIRAVFPSADDVQGLCVFNIGGNKFRLVTKIEYRWQKVFIKGVMTHDEYDLGAWKPKRKKK